ncbi:MAG: hypothetical protein Q8R37_01235 [Nanoarchaeota archaeon]|nr:hypothetical protein [Nanoarchaeota archaeon]
MINGMFFLRTKGMLPARGILLEEKINMATISNKTIAVLLVVALAITISGTFVSIYKLINIPGYNLLTGAAVNTTTGNATITIVSRTQITNRVSTIAFGTGYVNTTCPYCYIDSDVGILAGNVSCCALFNNVTAGFLIENTGNENVTLNFSCSGSCTAASFVNGTNPVFQFRMTNVSDPAAGSGKQNVSGDSILDTRGSCQAAADLGWNFSSYTAMTTRADLCGSNGSTTEYYFTANATADAVIMDLKVGIPDDSRPNTQQTATFTFSAESAG